MSSSFGPRQQSSRGDRYDFHRGIDIPAILGTPVYAVAAGKVRKAGNDPAFSDIAVQLEHCRSASDCFYSNYMHLTMPIVGVGDEVEAGQQIAYSGAASSSGFPHLHFEIREGSPEQPNGVHPLRYLPTPSWILPILTIQSIDDANTSSMSVEVQVDLPAMTPGLIQVVVTTSRRSTGETLEERVFDYDAWNQRYTKERNDRTIDNPHLDHIDVEPAAFNEESSVYSMRFRFNDLQGTADEDDLVIAAAAVDVHGNRAEVRLP